MILLGKTAPNGAVVALCLLDHDWEYGPRQLVLQRMTAHYQAVHRGIAIRIQVAPDAPPAFRPPPIDQVG